MIIDIVLVSILGAVNVYSLYMNRKLYEQLQFHKKTMVAYMKENNEIFDNQKDIMLKHTNQTNELLEKTKLELYEQFSENE